MVTKTTTFVATMTVVIVAILLTPMLNQAEQQQELGDDLTDQFPAEVRKWREGGEWMEVNGRRVFYVHRKCLECRQYEAETIALIHGFPTSSFDYHKVIPRLQRRYDVIVHDHVGFGFSDKPTSGFTYSLAEAAENTLSLWRKLNITSSTTKLHVIAHDMGDSILCEILSRHHRRQLPRHVGNFQSVTFTNGGMSYDRINFRLGQTLLSSYYLGAYFQRLSNLLGTSDTMAPRQLAEVFGAPQSDQTRNDVQAIVAINKHKGGLRMMDKLMYYLRERPRNEYKWYQALANITTMTSSINLVWGASDVVNPLPIAHFIRDQVVGGQRARLKTVPGAGHFVMLEKPDEWLEAVTSLLVTS